MNIMQVVGIILIVIVVALYLRWIQFTKSKSGAKAKEEGGVQTFTILVKGVYSPNVIQAQANKPIRVNFRREETNECSRFVFFPDFKIRQELPENQTTVIEFTPRRKGVFVFTCDMGMYQGKLIIE